MNSWVSFENHTLTGANSETGMYRREWLRRTARRRPGFGSFIAGVVIGCFVVSFVLENESLRGWEGLVGVVVIALVYQQGIWRLIRGWRRWR